MRKIVTLLSTILIVAAMLTAAPLTYEAHALTEEEQAWVNEARAALAEIVAEREIMAAVYLSDTYPVRLEAREDSETVVTVPSGQTVFIRDVVIADNYAAWSYVSLYYRGTEYYGYIPRGNIACSDERFLEWEMNYGMNPGAAAMYALTDEDGNAIYEDIEQFPESYQPALLALKEKHPNWTFVMQNTQLDWDTVIANEIVGGKSLVYKTLPDYCKEGKYDEGSWFYASEAILELYMDPRSGLSEDSVFQFELLTYNESAHTEAAIESFLNNTFMNSSQPAPGTVMTFSHIFWAVGAEDKRKVSPFHLAARVLQEQGVNGGSPLISGTYPGYEGYYNYFNVGASGTTDKQEIESGLQYAKNATLELKPYPWNNAYASILGGAEIISANYIQKGQDTLYLQKFNVAPDSANALYTHQYMQNISAPASEAKNIKKLYESTGALDSTFVFKIPVYENMPELPCAMPTSSTNVVLEIPVGYDATTVFVDGVPYDTVKRSDGGTKQRYIATVSGGDAESAVVFEYNAKGTPTGMYVWTLGYKNGAYTATAQPELEDLLTYHGFAIRITGKSGIRFMTGISTDVRSRLIAEGVNGYTLKEYGTLSIKDSVRDKYPLVKGGKKVMSGVSYGINRDGVMIDKILKTADGRHHYASVLVGLPATEYKTLFAFGGYIILEKDGVETTIYGPVMAKSIYGVAEQLLARGDYEVGSKTDLFLRQLIADGDAASEQTDTSKEESVSGGDAGNETVSGNN